MAIDKITDPISSLSLIVKTNEIIDNLENLVEVTYSQLVTLKTNAQLEEGRFYRITDYATTTNGNSADTTNEPSRSAGHPFDIIIEALGPSNLSEIGTCALRSGDTYFANQNLGAWQVWYDINNDTTKYAWADTTNGKGVIYRMIDEFNNDFPYDFKNIQFYRDKTATKYSSLSSAMTATDGYYFTVTDNTGIVDLTLSEAASDNKMKRYTVSNVRTLNNIVSIQYTDKQFKENVFSEDCYNNTFTYLVNNNNFGMLFHDNVILHAFGYNNFVSETYSNAIGNNFYENNIEMYFSGNTIGNNFHYNEIKASFMNNTIGNDFYANKLGFYFQTNTIGDSCYENEIGDYCQTNNLYANFKLNYVGHYFKNNKTNGTNFQKNSIGSYFQNNTVGSGFQLNVIDNNFTDNTFGNNFYYNKVGTYFTNNTGGNSFYYNMIGIMCRYNTFATGTLTFTNNTIGNTFQHNTVGANLKFNVIGEAVQYVTFPSDFTKYFIKSKVSGNSTDVLDLTGAPTGGNIVLEMDSTGQVLATYLSGDVLAGSKKASITATSWTDIVSPYTKTYTENNAALTASSGICTWTVTHSLGSNVEVHVYDNSTGKEVLADIALTSSTVATVELVSVDDIAADSYKVVVIGK